MNSSMFPKIMGQLLGEPRKMIDRKELLKHAGDMIIVRYDGHGADKNKVCFVIGWFFSLTEDAMHLKITSTRFETYEAREIPLEQVIGIQTHEMN